MSIRILSLRGTLPSTAHHICVSQIYKDSSKRCAGHMTNCRNTIQNLMNSRHTMTNRIRMSPKRFLHSSIQV